jgi:lysyl-tRNA synthetase class 2
MIEWYRVGDTHHDQMQIVEQLVVAVCTAAKAQLEESNARDRPDDVPYAISEPFLRTTYREAFLRHAGVDVVAMETVAIRDWSGDRGLHSPPGLADDDRDGWLNWLLAELVEPQLWKDRPEFLLDYPASQAALARIRPDSPPVAERFELYCRGIELCNGYHELGDADEIIRRIEVESARRENEGQTRLPAPQRFLASMRAGLPDCCGVALGFDRLMIIATGAESIDEVIPFPFELA